MPHHRHVIWPVTTTSPRRNDDQVLVGTRSSVLSSSPLQKGRGGGGVLRLSGPCLALWFQALVVDLGLCRGQGVGMGLGWGVSGLGLGCGWFWFWQSQAWLRAALSGMFMFIDEHVVFGCFQSLCQGYIRCC